MQESQDSQEDTAFSELDTTRNTLIDQSTLVDTTPLNEDEIEEAQLRIRRLHPLTEITLDKVFPTFGCCFRCCRRNKSTLKKQYTLLDDEKKALQKLDTIRKDLGIEDSETFVEEEDVDLHGTNSKETKSEDPYLQLGFGMCAYFSLLKMFILLFLVLTLLAIPSMFRYQYKATQIQLKL